MVIDFINDTDGFIIPCNWMHVILVLNKYLKKLDACNKTILILSMTLIQWEFQDPKTEVLYHIRPLTDGFKQLFYCHQERISAPRILHLTGFHHPTPFHFVFSQLFNGHEPRSDSLEVPIACILFRPFFFIRPIFYSVIFPHMV